MTGNEKTAVCIVVENLPVPLDRRVWAEARALRDAGYLVSVVCPKGKKSCTAGYETIEGIQIYRHKAWEASSKFGYILEYGLALLAEFYLVLRVFARTRFRILQGCNPPDNIFLLALLLKPFGVRYIFDHHDLAPEALEAKFGKANGVLSAFTRFAEKCSFQTATVSLATNESFKEKAIQRGGKRPDQVFIVRNCPDLTAFGPRTPQPEIQPGKPLLIAYVGFMGRQDGVDLLIEAIEYIVKTEKRRDAHFLLMGGGTMLAELQNMAAQKDLLAFVTFTGQIAHDEVVRHLSNADIGVASDPKTPMNDCSTMIKIFEYMAAGLPVVLFDLKEGRNTAGNAALYATPNDTADLARHIIALLDDKELRLRLGATGRKRVENGLNWESEKTSLLEAYSVALENRRSPRQQSEYLLERDANLK